MTPLLYKKTGTSMALTLVGEKIDRSCFTDEKIDNSTSFNCDFSSADLNGTELIGCQFYDRESRRGYNFSRTMPRDAIFKSCDLSMAGFRNTNALGIEIRHCRAQGTDFRGAGFMNMIATYTQFCSACITNTNLNYANLSKVVLERYELWENRWMGAQILDATFNGSDLLGGGFSAFNWRAANFTRYDLASSELGNLDTRGVDLQGVKLDNYQTSLLMERLGVAVIGQHSRSGKYRFRPYTIASALALKSLSTHRT